MSRIGQFAGRCDYLISVALNSARAWMPSVPGAYRFSCAEIGYRSIDVQVRRNDADVLVATAPGLGTETVSGMHRKLTRAEWEVVDVD